MGHDAELLRSTLIKIMCQIDYFLVKYSEDPDFVIKARKVALSFVEVLNEVFDLPNNY